MAIGKFVEIKFLLRIDGEDTQRLNADIFRLYELLRATLEVHSHNGFHGIESSCANREKLKPEDSHE